MIRRGHAGIVELVVVVLVVVVLVVVVLVVVVLAVVVLVVVVLAVGVLAVADAFERASVVQPAVAIANATAPVSATQRWEARAMALSLAHRGVRRVVTVSP